MDAVKSLVVVGAHLENTYMKLRISRSYIDTALKITTLWLGLFIVGAVICPW